MLCIYFQTFVCRSDISDKHKHVKQCASTYGYDKYTGQIISQYLDGQMDTHTHPETDKNSHLDAVHLKIHPGVQLYINVNIVVIFIA